MNQSHMLFGSGKAAPTDGQGTAPQKAAGRMLVDWIRVWETRRTMCGDVSVSARQSCPRRRLRPPNCLQPGYHCEVHHSPDWTPHGAAPPACSSPAARPQTCQRGRLANRGHRHRPLGLDRRHKITRHQPRPPPRRTPPRQHRPTHTTTRSERTQRAFELVAGPPRLDEHPFGFDGDALFVGEMADGEGLDAVGAAIRASACSSPSRVMRR